MNKQKQEEKSTEEIKQQGLEKQPIVNDQFKIYNEEKYDEDEKQFVVFKLEDQEYGIESMKVHEIDRLKEIIISPVPKTPEFVEGIINLRGEVVPIIDLRKKLGLPQKEVDKKSRILIVKIEKKMIGLLVDSVSEVIDIVENTISLPPDEVADVNTRYLAGVAKFNKRLILLLNINEILVLEEKEQSEKPI